MVRRRRARRVSGELVLGIITDTVLDLRAEEGPVSTVAELDRHLDRITGEIADYRVRPVEVGLFDTLDISTRGLFIGVGGIASYAVYLSRAGNEFISVSHAATAAVVTEFDVPARALIPVEQARCAMRQFLTTRQRPTNITWELASPTADQ